MEGSNLQDTILTTSLERNTSATQTTPEPLLSSSILVTVSSILTKTLFPVASHSVRSDMNVNDGPRAGLVSVP